jgi:alpha-mannosidase
MTQPNSLIVCPTSHMDWDWTSSFEEYYKTTVAGAGTGSVQQILGAAVSLSGSESTFFFSLAELGWLQRYLVDQGGTPPSPSTIPQSICLMGGAITSPDNIVCDGEVFVRAYLVGRQWALSVGLESAIENVSWMPDDFGHDPELPVILSAMGLTAVGFARVPGAFPNFNSPLSGPSLACTLMLDGVAFNWQASDGSLVFAHFMPNTYGVPFASAGAGSNASSWESFVTSGFLSSYPCQSLPAVVWPGGIAFAPAGGDFSVPDSGWVDGVTTFNQNQKVTTASVGTFPDYISAVLKSGVALASTKIDPSNFWTGLFGSRPALKTLQARASRDLVAAESVSSLLWLGAVTGSAALEALDGAIQQVWNILAPSSHHDFVTGTSPDRVYKMEQLPMLSLAASMARQIYGRALQIIADSISPAGGHVVAVHNAVGVARSGVFRLERGAAVSFPTSGTATIQPLADGGLLVMAPVVPSLGYISGVVTFNDPPPTQDPVDVHHKVMIDNGTVAITLSHAQLWAITSIKLNGGHNLLPTDAAANLLQIYDDIGNLYQYGNELGAGGFAPQKTGLTAGKAVQKEFGPLRWRVEAELHGANDSTYRVEYTLIIGESLVRIKVTGSAPASTTVVASFPAIATDGQTKATHLIYGTAHHFHEDAAPPYWQGPMFKATHDFLMPAAGSGSIFALAAIYHCGTPAWACNDGVLLGSLFRNTNGQQRGAAGTDSDTHVQRYALRLSTTALDPTQGTPLVEALQAMNPLRAAASPGNNPENPVTLQASASLASAQSPALVRVTRPMGQLKSPACTSPAAQVALRIYRPDADGSSSSVEVTMPILTSASNATAALVTALEDPIGNAPALTVNVDAMNVPANFAVTTVALTATRPITIPSNGKGQNSQTCAQTAKVSEG